MDDIDEKLLDLAEKGVTKYASLARRLEMPLSTVHSRMKKLEMEGFIRGYRADIDWKKAGLSLMAFVLIKVDVNMLKKTGMTQDEFLEDLLQIDYVDEGYVITGEADLMIKITARDSTHLKDILLRDIDALEGIVGTRTIIVLG